MSSIAIVGMGKLGLCTAACLAYKGHQVIGVDIDQSVVEAINSGRSPLYEPGIAEMMKRVTGNFTATTDYKYAVDNSDVIFIFVATPSDADGRFSTRYVEEVTKEIAVNIKGRNDFPVIALRSTVLPGVTADVVRPILEEISGLKCGAGFGLCYNPEILALGSVIHDFLNPDVIVIGESDSRSGELLSEIYHETCDNSPPVVKTSLYNAEIAKISLNVFLTMKMSFANTIAEMCERIPGGDIDAISDILGRDKRIGRKFLTGAIGWGGPCFPRDTKAFSSLARELGCQSRLAQASDEVNERQSKRVVKSIEQRLGKVEGKTIAILGLTYKPNTDIVLESDAIRIAGALLKEKARLSVYDPAGMENARQVLGREGIRYAASAVECLKEADLCVLATPWDEFKNLKAEDFTQNMRKPMVLDCWRALRQPGFCDKLDYFAVGLNPIG